MDRILLEPNYADDPRITDLADGSGWLITPDDGQREPFTLVQARGGTFLNAVAHDGAIQGGCDNSSGALDMYLHIRLGHPIT